VVHPSARISHRVPFGTGPALRSMLADDPPTHYPSVGFQELKRFIDAQVTYGKNKRGLSGQTEGVLKELRTDIDKVLDETFPAYDQVNTQYSDTIRAIDAFQDAAGKKIDMFGPDANKAIGTTARRLLGNRNTRIPLDSAIEELDIVAEKYPSGSGVLKIEGPGGDVQEYDTIYSLVKFADELEKRFGTHASTSFQGDIAKPIEMAVEASKGGIGETILRGAKHLSEKARGIDDDAALQAISDLLDGK
jgi:hypothetical protein